MNDKNENSQATEEYVTPNYGGFTPRPLMKEPLPTPRKVEGDYGKFVARPLMKEPLPTPRKVK